MELKYRKIIFYLLGFIAISDILTYVTSAGFNQEYFTYLSSVAKYLALSILIFISYKSYWKNNLPKAIYVLYVLYLIWNIITIVRGGFSSTDYWDWKFLLLSSLLFLLIPLAFFVGKHLYFAQQVFKYVSQYFFPFGFLLVPLTLATNRELYSRIMIPIGVFILFIPYLRSNWRKLIVLVAFISIALVIDFRTNLIKIFLSVLILLLYYFRNFIFQSWVKAIHLGIFILPFIFVYLGIVGRYNVFAKAEEKNNYTVKAQKGDFGTVNLAGDTRTFLYEEVFSSLLKNGTLVFGEGGTGKYKTEFFDTIKNRGRYGSEVGFLNVLLYSGIIGGLVYFLILFTSSFYAIYYSNNFLCKMLGLLIATRWLLFFIEEYTNFDLNTFFTWIIIGLISNREFRLLTDQDLKLFFDYRKPFTNDTYSHTGIQ
jgi:hypothetical protein